MDDPEIKRLVADIQASMEDNDVSQTEEIQQTADQLPSNGHNQEVEADPTAGWDPVPTPAMTYAETTTPAPKRSYKSRAKDARQPPPVSGQAEINAVLGSAVSFKISKIDDQGKLGYIYDYSVDNIRPYGMDMERFIRENLMATYGDGTYYVEAKDERGNPGKGKRFTVLSPYRAPGAAGIPPVESSARVVDSLLKRLEQIESRPQPDPVQQLARMQEVMGGNKNDVSPMLLMMMMQQQQHPAGSELAAIRAELRELARPQPLPPPPLPTPPTLAEQLIQLAPVIMPLIAPLLNRKEPPSFMEQVMQAMPMVRDFIGTRNDTAAEVHKLQLEHLKEKIEDLSTGDTIGSTLENLRQAKELFKEIGGGPAESALKYFAENFEANMHALAAAAKSIRGVDEQPRLGPPAAAAPPLATAPAAPKLPPLPPEFNMALVKVNEAQTDKERLFLMLVALRVLYSHNFYRAIPIKLVAQIKMGLVDQFADDIKLLMEDLVENRLIGQPAATAVTRAAKENFDEIRRMVKEGAIEIAPESQNGEAEEETEE